MLSKFTKSAKAGVNVVLAGYVQYAQMSCECMAYKLMLSVDLYQEISDGEHT